MTVYKKAVILLCFFVVNSAAWIVVGLTTGLGAWVLVPILAVFLYFSASSMSLKCPRCGKSVYVKTVGMFGKAWTYSGGGFPERRCSRCDFDLNRATEREQL